MNVYTWTLGASHTPAAFLAVGGHGLPFDLTDTVASFLFGLAFAPELARLLARLRARMDVSWEAVEPRAEIAASRPVRALGAPGPLVALALAVGLGAGLAGGLAQPPPASAASFSRELGYLASAQNPDGGYGASTSQHSSELYTGWVAMGFAAAGRNPASVRRNGHSLLDSLRGEASTLSNLGDVERTVLAVHACGASASRSAGATWSPKCCAPRAGDGSFGGLVDLTSFAILALRAAGRRRAHGPIRNRGALARAPAERRRRLRLRRHGRAATIDDTARRCRRSPPRARATAAGRARGRLPDALADADGGFPHSPGGESNAQSTAWAVQGLIAAGVSRPRCGAEQPLAGGLPGKPARADGSIRYSRTSAQTPAWVTAQALVALAGKTFPVG